jgi:peptidoglycan/LPS O-acetylase OafA/YrhL
MRFWVIVAACAVFAAISIKLRMSTASYDSNGLHQPQALMFAFAPGVLLEAISVWAPAWLSARQQIGRAISWVFYGIFWIGLPFYILETTKWSATRHAVFGAVMGAAIVIAPLVRQWTDGHTTKLLDNPPANWIGKRSYSFYLFHLVALRLIFDNIYRNHGEPGKVFLMFAMEMAVMIPVAWIGYQYIERPFIVRRAPWRRRLPAAAEPATAPASPTIPADAAAPAIPPG